MNIIVKPEAKEINKYIDLGINTFLLPLENYSVEFNSYFSFKEIKDIKEKYSDLNIFVSINKNIFNSELEDLEKILIEFDNLKIKGIFFYDIAVLSLKKKLNLNLDMVWNQTFMVTNYKTCNYYYERGAKYALISKEITKDEIIQIIKNTKIKPIVELISYPTVAFSKRSLVSNYYQNYSLDKQNELNVVEPKSKQKYLIKEDKNGVSFTNNKVMNLSSILKELLDNNLEYIYLKEDLINSEVFLEVIKNITYYINNYKNIDDNEYKKWLNKQNKLLGRNTNFLYRKTIYKVK